MGRAGEKVAEDKAECKRIELLVKSFLVEQLSQLEVKQTESMINYGLKVLPPILDEIINNTRFELIECNGQNLTLKDEDEVNELTEFFEQYSLDKDGYKSDLLMLFAAINIPSLDPEYLIEMIDEFPSKRSQSQIILEEYYALLLIPFFMLININKYLGLHKDYIESENNRRKLKNKNSKISDILKKELRLIFSDVVLYRDVIKPFTVSYYDKLNKNKIKTTKLRKDILGKKIIVDENNLLYLDAFYSDILTRRSELNINNENIVDICMRYINKKISFTDHINNRLNYNLNEFNTKYWSDNKVAGDKVERNRVYLHCFKRIEKSHA